MIGPTASGKESVALEIARCCDVEILSLDSMKVYRGMDVGTAKATPEARTGVPHHLLDLADPTESFSTKRWLTAAESAMAEVSERGKVPLFVGGTALYLKALLSGLFEGPDAQPEIRARLKAVPRGELHRRLAEVDPRTAAKVHVNDVRRVVRALEVFEVTGVPASELRREWESDRPLRPSRLAGIQRSREDLYERIRRRVSRMLDAGLVEEVRALLERPGGLGPVARQALGYKEVADFLESALDSLEEAVELLVRRTKTFARRQLTWFKHFEVAWVDAGPGEESASIAERTRAALGL
ncbi:MAG: tRNA (adenosine(37)-N6)-dimethylallyltransferase MiaA [Planctomycetota bacterium]